MPSTKGTLTHVSVPVTRDLCPAAPWRLPRPADRPARPVGHRLAGHPAFPDGVWPDRLADWGRRCRPPRRPLGYWSRDPVVPPPHRLKGLARHVAPGRRGPTAIEGLRSPES